MASSWSKTWDGLQLTSEEPEAAELQRPETRAASLKVLWKKTMTRCRLEAYWDVEYTEDVNILFSLYDRLLSSIFYCILYLNSLFLIDLIFHFALHCCCNYAIFSFFLRRSASTSQVDAVSDWAEAPPTSKAFPLMLYQEQQGWTSEDPLGTALPSQLRNEVVMMVFEASGWNQETENVQKITDHLPPQKASQQNCLTLSLSVIWAIETHLAVCM